MSSKAVLQQEVHLHEGKVIGVETDGLWIEDTKGHQTSILLHDSRRRFRVGQEAKAVTVATDDGHVLVKAMNFSTGEVIYGSSEFHARLDTSGLRGLVRAGAGTLLSVNSTFAFVLLVPLLNCLAALYFVLAAIGLSSASTKPIKVLSCTLVTGFLSMGGFVLFCMLSPSLYLFGLFTPAIGVFAGYCYLGQTLSDQVNIAIDKIEQRLGTTRTPP